MSDFGDADPEDEWDAADPFGAKVAVLIRMVLSIANEHHTAGHNHARVLVRLGFAEAAVEGLRANVTDTDRPILDALALAFYYLTVSEGVT